MEHKMENLESKMKGNWNQYKGKIKEKWGELTNDDLDRIEGRKDQLIGRIQKTYGKTKEEAEREVDKFFSNF